MNGSSAHMKGTPGIHHIRKQHKVPNLEKGPIRPHHTGSLISASEPPEV